MNHSRKRSPAPELPNHLSPLPKCIHLQGRTAVASGISAYGKSAEYSDCPHGARDDCSVNPEARGPSLDDRQGNPGCLVHQPFTNECLRILELDSLGNRQYERFGPPREGFGSHTSISRPRPAPFGSWISFIPSHLGHNRALDAAVDCTTCAFDGLVFQETIKKRQARRKYIKALLILQNVLNGPDALSAETLCAMMLLSLFEVSD
jgi:hypothetical protein